MVDGNEVIESENVNCAPEGGPVKYYETSSKDPEVAAFSEPFMWLFQTLLNSEDSVVSQIDGINVLKQSLNLSGTYPKLLFSD